MKDLDSLQECTERILKEFYKNNCIYFQMGTESKQNCFSMGKERRYKSISTYWNYSNSHWQLSCHVIWGMLSHVVCYTELWQWYRDNKTFLKQFQLYFYSFYIYILFIIVSQNMQSSRNNNNQAKRAEKIATHSNDIAKTNLSWENCKCFSGKT